MNIKPIIEFSNLSKTYRGMSIPAINNLAFTVYENEIFGLLGPNGAGKTTLLSILCGLIKHSKGKVNIFGLDLQKNINTIRKSIGVVPQDIALYQSLTARENLRFYGNMYGLFGKQLNEKINTCLNVFGLESKADSYISTFSGGMKRRTNIIAGILHEPKILFLDEPTVGVDVQTKNVIVEYLLHLNKTGTTIIYTSHIMSEVENFCTRVAIIDRGEFLISGTPSEIVKQHPQQNNLEEVFLNLTGKSLRD